MCHKLVFHVLFHKRRGVFYQNIETHLIIAHFLSDLFPWRAPYNVIPVRTLLFIMLLNSTVHKFHMNYNVNKYLYCLKLSDVLVLV